MVDAEEIKGYFRKLLKTVENADFSLFGYKLVKKNKIDDLFCCILGTLPASYKAAAKKRAALDAYPSVASYNRLIKVIKNQFFFSKNYYKINYSEITVLIKNININIERDLNRLEQT